MTKSKEFNPFDHIREQLDEGKISLAESMTLSILVKISDQLDTIIDKLEPWILENSK